MGLSICYSGRLKDPKDLKPLTKSVAAWAEVYNWDYHIIRDSFPEEHFTNNFDEQVYGILVNPKMNCESIALTFLSDGYLVNVPLFYCYQEEGRTLNLKDIRSIWVKTQFAGPKIHKIIVDFFRYLEREFFQDFKFNDESGYWETNDEAVLQGGFDRYNRFMDLVTTAVSGIPAKGSENLEDSILKALKKIKDQAEGDKLKDNNEKREEDDQMGAEEEGPES